MDRAAEEHDWQTLEDTGEAWRYFGNPVQGEEWRTSLRRHARRLHRPIPTGRAVQHQEGSLPLLVVAALDGVSWQWICRSFPEFQPPDSGTWPTESWYWAILRDWWERKPVDEQRRLLRAVREMVWKSILATPHEGLLPVPATEVPYRTANEDVHAVKRDPFVVDPNIVDRGLRGHAVTQNALADFLVSSGLNPVSPGIQHPDFDLGWLQGDTFYVAEVKSLTKENESTHLRLGLGQVLYYRYRLEQTGYKVQAVLAVERKPIDPHWAGVCERTGVMLVWPPRFARLRTSDNSGAPTSSVDPEAQEAEGTRRLT